MKLTVLRSAFSFIFSFSFIMGKMEQVQWEDTCGELSDGDGNISADDVDYGVLLTVGFLPGIKVEVIPMLGSDKVKFLPHNLTS